MLQPVHRQIGPLVRVLGGQLFVDVYPVAGGLAAVHHAALKAVIVRKDREHLFAVRHELLHAKVGHPGVKVQGCAHAHG